MKTITLVIVVVALISCLGLVATLLRLRSQRKQSEVRERMSEERSKMQRQVDQLKDRQKPQNQPKHE